MVAITQSLLGHCFDLSSAKVVPVRIFTLTNKNNMSVEIITLGAAIFSIELPDRDGVLDDVVFGLGMLKEYFADRSHFENYDHLFNSDRFKSLDMVIWDGHIVSGRVVLSHVSKNVEEADSFPGGVMVKVVYQLTDDNELKIEYAADTTTGWEPIFKTIDITNRTLFNLGGYSSGIKGFLNHVICINADKILLTDDKGVKMGHMLVEGTPVDCRNSTWLRNYASVETCMHDNIGFDHVYSVKKLGYTEEPVPFARINHLDTGRVLEFFCDSPFVRFSIMDWLTGSTREALPKSLDYCSGLYYKNCGMFLEPQNHEDSPNKRSGTGRFLAHHVTYKFSTD